MDLVSGWNRWCCFVCFWNFLFGHLVLPLLLRLWRGPGRQTRAREGSHPAGHLTGNDGKRLLLLFLLFFSYFASSLSPSHPSLFSLFFLLPTSFSSLSSTFTRLLYYSSIAYFFISSFFPSSSSPCSSPQDIVDLRGTLEVFLLLLKGNFCLTHSATPVFIRPSALLWPSGRPPACTPAADQQRRLTRRRRRRTSSTIFWRNSEKLRSRYFCTFAPEDLMEN